MRMITKVLSGKSVDVQETSTRRFLLPTPFLVVESSQDSQQLIWYTNWVEEQIRNQPDILFTTLQLDENATDEKTTDENLEIKRWQNEAVVSLWCSVAKLCSTQSSSSIEEIVNSLENSGSLRLPATNDELFYSQNLVMAIIGWQTMLFRPDIGSCPQPQLAIADETDGFRTHAQIALKQDQFRCSSKLHVFLSGFGQLLPSLSVPAFSSDEDKLALRQFTTVAPASLNVHVLTTVGSVNIRWTDSLACHLEFDRGSNTMWLFKYPSFCSVHLRETRKELRHCSTLHACARPPGSHEYWASREEVDQYLGEVLLSYRLLFAQKKKSRRLFATIDPFRNEASNHKDPLLRSLCTGVQYTGSVPLRQRDLYDLAKDMPLLREKVVVLLRHLSLHRPRTWKELWSDKRDSASWFTFWAVVIIGGLGLLMAFLQLVLATVQVVLEAKQGS